MVKKYEKKSKLDEQEKKIVRELIKNPRISDNQISKITGIPLRTVNRKRKILERDGLLYYFAYFDLFSSGTGLFRAKYMYVIQFNAGVSRVQIINALEKMFSSKPNFLKHLFESFVGEADGKIALVFIIGARVFEDAVEVFNVDVIPEITRLFGASSIHSVNAINLTDIVCLLRNYFPYINKNTSRGTLRKEWPDSSVYVED